MSYAIIMLYYIKLTYTFFLFVYLTKNQNLRFKLIDLNSKQAHENLE